MPDHVLTCRIYFNDAGNAENAFNHIKALAEHSAAHDRQVGGQSDTSWARLHECYVSEDNGDTDRCATSMRFVLNENITDPETEVRIWAPGQTYTQDEQTSHNSVIYKQMQPTHTTQVGWEPGAAGLESIWQVV